jgi:transposase
MISELPEFKALSLADAISEADTPLKECTPEERLEARRTVVRPKFDAYIDYIRSLDIDDPSCSEKLRDAVRYTLNQEDKLRRFLDDPMIPADNGFCERSIRPLATARRNWLFSYSVSGAESAAILFTLVETAKANQAHPYYYLKYLLETLPKKKTTKGNSFLDDCMPWSESYMAYERIQKRGALSFLADTDPPEVPRTPRKMDRCG